MIKNYYTLQTQPQSAKEIITTLVNIGGTIKGGIKNISFVSFASGVLVPVTLLVPKLAITINDNKKLKKQNEELKQIIKMQQKKGELNEQTI